MGGGKKQMKTVQKVAYRRVEEYERNIGSQIMKQSPSTCLSGPIHPSILGPAFRQARLWETAAVRSKQMAHEDFIALPGRRVG